MTHVHEPTPSCEHLRPAPVAARAGDDGRRAVAAVRRFLTQDNGWNILRQISVNLCLSVGMTLVILAGGIDLSVGAVLALAGAVAAGLLKNGLVLAGVRRRPRVHRRPARSSPASLVGRLLGWVNGIVITRFGVPPFVATLGMLSIARGLTQLWTGGFPITASARFGFLGTGIAAR